MKTVASLLSGVVCAVALFVVMHELFDDSPQFIDPIVEVFDLPVDRAPDKRPAPQQDDKDPAGPSQLVRAPGLCSPTDAARLQEVACPDLKRP
ncbi:MAG: hypothetical protein HKO55_04750 [Gammaproteobacteria bacterium]|nr:hypothetical protein [Gammaproteobacteria bacterium]